MDHHLIQFDNELVGHPLSDGGQNIVERLESNLLLKGIDNILLDLNPLFFAVEQLSEELRWFQSFVFWLSFDAEVGSHSYLQTLSVSTTLTALPNVGESKR